MHALVTVDGFEFPEPSTYNATTATIVDSGRNVQGRLIGAVVRHDVAKVEMSWKYLTAAQWSSVLKCFKSKFYCNVTFYNQTTASYDTRQMYVSDRTGGMFRRDPHTGEVMGWTNPSMSLVEV